MINCYYQNQHNWAKHISGRGVEWRCVDCSKTMPYVSTYDERIKFLIDCSEMDDEIEPINRRSLSEFLLFIALNNITAKAGLVLQDNGNLRAIWRRKNPYYNIGLEFLGDNEILYVLFNEKERKANICSVEEIMQIIQQHKVDQYLYEEKNVD